MLQAQAHPLSLRVELEDLDADVVADLEQLRRVVDAAPAHIGDMQESVDAAEVDEGAVLGEVLDDAPSTVWPSVSFSSVCSLSSARSFSGSTRRDRDDVAALLIELNYL